MDALNFLLHLNVLCRNKTNFQEISFTVTDDFLPEFDEYYQVKLTNVVGGGRLAEDKLKTKIVIDENDAPYGLFSIQPSYLRYDIQ